MDARPDHDTGTDPGATGPALLAVLQRIEENQRRALAVQAEHLALVQAQFKRSEEKVAESLALQKVAMSRQAFVNRFVLPVLLAALAYVGWMIFRTAGR